MLATMPADPAAIGDAVLDGMLRRIQGGDQFSVLERNLAFYDTSDPTLRARVTDYLSHEPSGRHVDMADLQRSLLSRGNYSKIPLMDVLRDMEREGQIRGLDQFGFDMAGSLAGSSSHAGGECPGCGMDYDAFRGGMHIGEASQGAWNAVRRGAHETNVHSSAMGIMAANKQTQWEIHKRDCGGSAYAANCAAEKEAAMQANMSRWGTPFADVLAANLRFSDLAVDLDAAEAVARESPMGVSLWPKIRGYLETAAMAGAVTVAGLTAGLVALAVPVALATAVAAVALGQMGAAVAPLFGFSVLEASERFEQSRAKDGKFGKGGGVARTLKKAGIKPKAGAGGGTDKQRKGRVAQATADHKSGVATHPARKNLALKSASKRPGSKIAAYLKKHAEAIAAMRFDDARTPEAMLDLSDWLAEFADIIATGEAVGIPQEMVDLTAGGRHLIDMAASKLGLVVEDGADWAPTEPGDTEVYALVVTTPDAGNEDANAVDFSILARSERFGADMAAVDPFVPKRRGRKKEPAEVVEEVVAAVPEAYPWVQTISRILLAGAVGVPAMAAALTGAGVPFAVAHAVAAAATTALGMGAGLWTEAATPERFSLAQRIAHLARIPAHLVDAVWTSGALAGFTMLSPVARAVDLTVTGGGSALSRAGEAGQDMTIGLIADAFESAYASLRAALGRDPSAGEFVDLAKRPSGPFSALASMFREGAMGSVLERNAKFFESWRVEIEDWNAGEVVHAEDGLSMAAGRARAYDLANQYNGRAGAFLVRLMDGGDGVELAIPSGMDRYTDTAARATFTESRALADRVAFEAGDRMDVTEIVARVRSGDLTGALSRLNDLRFAQPLPPNLAAPVSALHEQVKAEVLAATGVAATGV